MRPAHLRRDPRLQRGGERGRPPPRAHGQPRSPRPAVRDPARRRRLPRRHARAPAWRSRRADPRVRVLRLRRNFGQTAAFSAGFDHARGDVVVTSDGDLQNDPADIPRAARAARRGLRHGVRLAARAARPVLARRCPSWFANRLISWATGVHLHDYGCSLKAMRAEVVRGHAPLRRDAPLHPRGRVLDGRERGRDAGEPPRRAPAAAASTASAARCACCSTSSRSSSCSPTARGPRTCSASGASPAARLGHRHPRLPRLREVLPGRERSAAGRCCSLGVLLVPLRRASWSASACWPSCWSASTTRARASRSTW